MKQENQEQAILYKVEKLEDLVINQEKALIMANELLDMKNRLIEICEEETEIYRAENKRLTRSLIISAVLFAIVAVMNIIRSLY